MDVMTALAIYEMDERHPQLEEALQRLLECEALTYIKHEIQEELEHLQRENKMQKQPFFPRQNPLTELNSASA